MRATAMRDGKALTRLYASIGDVLAQTDEVMPARLLRQLRRDALAAAPVIQRRFGS
jgi:hypothetical protein